MAAVTADLNESATVILDGTGTGQAKLSPVGARYSGYEWEPAMCYVSVSTNAKEAKATTYVSYGIQSAQPTDAIGTTITGSTGDTCTMSQKLKPGDWVITKWTGGDAGAVATMRLTGSVRIPVPEATVR